MINNEEYFKDNKFIELIDFTQETIKRLDEELDKKGYLYKGVFREDLERGGYVSVWEAVRRKGRTKNIITLRPQTCFLKVEIFYSRNSRKYFNIYDYKNFEIELMDEIDKIYNKIAF